MFSELGHSLSPSGGSEEHKGRQQVGLSEDLSFVLLLMCACAHALYTMFCVLMAPEKDEKVTLLGQSSTF